MFTASRQLDTVAIDRVCETIGLAFAAAAAAASPPLVDDDSIPPDEFHAGLMLAHIKGLASAIAARSPDPRTRHELCEDAFKQLRRELYGLGRQG